MVSVHILSWATISNPKVSQLISQLTRHYKLHFFQNIPSPRAIPTDAQFVYHVSLTEHDSRKSDTSRNDDKASVDAVEK